MIPEIGVMIGCYIITKMLSLYAKKESKTVKTFCGITVIVAILCSLDLIIRAF